MGEGGAGRDGGHTTGEEGGGNYDPMRFPRDMHYLWTDDCGRRVGCL